MPRPVFPLRPPRYPELPFLDNWGARGNGRRDDTWEVRRAVNEAGPFGGPVFLRPHGHYICKDTITCKDSTAIQGFQRSADSSGTWRNLAVLDFTSMTGAGERSAILGAGNAQGFMLKNLRVDGPDGSNASAANPRGIIGVRMPDYGGRAIIDGVVVRGFTTAILDSNSQNSAYRDVFIKRPRVVGLELYGCAHTRIWSGIFSDAGAAGAGAADPGVANLLIDGTATKDIKIMGLHLDECIAGTATQYNGWIRRGTDIDWFGCHVYFPPSGIGLRVGDGTGGPTRFSVHEGRVEPYASGVPSNTIVIEPGSIETRLDLVTTNPNGGGDIVDNGTRSIFRDVNGISARRRRKTADTSNSSNVTWVTDPHLTFDLEANKDYGFEFIVPFSSAKTTTGLQLAMIGPDTPTMFSANIQVPTSKTAMVQAFVVAYDDPALGTAVAAIDTVYIAQIRGIIRNGANAGSLAVRFRSEIDASAVTLKSGATGELYALV